MTHAAIHDALNAIDRRYRPYALNTPVTQGASPEAAVATAAHHVLVNQFNQLIAFGFAPQQALLDAAYTSSLAEIPSGPAKTAGILIGQIAAATILSLRVNDGWDQQVVQDFAYPQGTAPGEYRFTPPSNFAFLPNWGKLPPFVLFRADQYRPSPPYPVNSSVTRRITTKSKISVGMAAPYRAPGLPTKRRSPSSGTRVLRLAGIASPELFRRREDLACGKTRGCLRF